MKDESTPQQLPAEFLKKRRAVDKLLKRKLKQALKSKNKFSLELHNALMWEKHHHEATLLQSNLFKIKKGMHKIRVQDWLQDNTEIEISLNPTLLPSEEIAKRFRKSKKLKKGIEPLKNLHDQAEKNVEKISSLITKIPQITTDKDLESFCQTYDIIPQKQMLPKSEKLVAPLPYRTFITEAGLEIWIGKSAKDNDKLTFTYAHGSDYWLHAQGVPGSHVVLRLGKLKEPDEDSLKDAVQAALFYSKSKDKQEGEICITQRKYVSRLGKKEPGKVQISHHRIVYAKTDQGRLKKLRERKKNY